jgi:solute carrier family 25 aspartate/glutamate transporter 12/13
LEQQLVFILFNFIILLLYYISYFDVIVIYKGVCGTSFIYPIDMIKTRLQSDKINLYKGPLDAAKKIIKTEGGFAAFYRGLIPNLVGVTPEKAIKLAVNEVIRDYYEKPDGSIQLKHEMIAGAGAGFCQVAI